MLIPFQIHEITLNHVPAFAIITADCVHINKIVPFTQGEIA
jgi:hypothetical protein